MTDDLGDMMQGGPPPAAGPPPKDDPLFQMMTGTGGDAAAPTAPGPAAPAQPGAPRAKARLPTPTPGTPPGGIVTAKEDLSPGAVFSGAVSSALPSAFNQITQTVKPLLDWKGDAQLAHTLLTDPGKVGQAISDVYGSRYDLAHPDREGGILQTFKHDPFAPLSDAAAVASLLTGGELLAPKLAGTAGDVASIAGKVGRYGQYLDPAYAAAQMVGKPTAAVLNRPGLAARIGRDVGRAGGATAGLAIPVPGAHLVTGMVGQQIGGDIGAGVGRVASKVARLPAVRQGMRTAEGLIPAATVGAGLAPMSPEEQAQTPYGQGQAAPPGASPATAPTGGGPQLDPRYADDPLYQMMMGGSPAPAPSASGPVGPHSASDVDTAVRMAAAEGDPNPLGWASVAAVMRNRAMLSGQSLSQVAAERGQFEAYGNKNYNALQPGSARYQSILQSILPVLRGETDPTHGADSYYAPHLQMDVDKRPKPTWDRGDGQMIGTQLFFRGKYRGGRYANQQQGYAAGGQVIDLTERLLERAGRAQKAEQSSTKPLLGLSDDTVAQALRVAQRGI